MSLEEELAEDISETESLAGLQEREVTVQEDQKPQDPGNRFTHEQIKSYIAILTSALGGIDHTSAEVPPPYKLGDEALLCLQDIMKWLRSYDGKSNSWEVAVACAESGLVNDLVRILCMWDDYSDLENVTFSKISKDYDRKIANGSLKILEFLLRPIELKSGIFKNQLTNYYILKKHELSYKKLLITYRKGLVFKAAIKLTLPVLNIASNVRKQQEHGLIRLVVLFILNFLKIEQMENLKQYKKISKAVQISENLPKGLKLEDIDIGQCISCFERNLVFPFILTLSANIRDELHSDILSEIILEIQYLLTKNIRPETIMKAKKRQGPTSASTSSKDTSELTSLLSKEKEMKTNFQKQTSSRHGRFGTLLSLQTTDMGRLTVLNAGNLINSDKNPIKAFDRHKEWRMTTRFRYNADDETIYPETSISSESKLIFKSYVNDFIDGALNPFVKTLVLRLASQDEGTDGSIFSSTLKVNYLLVISWFLEAQKLRGDVKDIDYGLVGTIISEESLILVRKFAAQSLKNKFYKMAHAALITFKQLFAIINNMELSNDIDYRDTARSFKERMFHKPESVSVIRDLFRDAEKRNPQYVDSCVDLLDIVLNTLENFSKEDMEKVITDKVTRRTKKNVTKEQKIIDQLKANTSENLSESDKVDIRLLAVELSKARKDDFKRIQARFATPGMVDTYMEYFKRFKDIQEKNLKKALQFFHRIFFKAKLYVPLYRIDFFNQLHLMLSEDHGVPRNSSIRTHLYQFMKNFMRQFKKHLKNSESLFIEILFPQNLKTIDSYSYYLKTGQRLVKQEKVVSVSKIIEIIGDFDLKQKVSILVASLIDDDKLEMVKWIGSELQRVFEARMTTVSPPGNTEEKKSSTVQETRPVIIKSDDPSKMKALISEPKLRYILKLADFELPQDTTQDCIFPVYGSLTKLIDVSELVQLYQITPVEFEGGKKAQDFIKVHNIASSLRDRYAAGDEEMEEFVAREESDEESDRYYSTLLDNLEDAVERVDRADGGSYKGVAKAKRKRIERKDPNSGNPTRNRPRNNREAHESIPLHELSDDEEISHRRRGPQFVSSKYVVDSDDESDDEADRAFFEKEMRLRDFLNRNEGGWTPEKLNEFLRGESNSQANVKAGGVNEEEKNNNEKGKNKRHSEVLLKSPIVKKQKDRVNEDDKETDGFSMENGSMEDDGVHIDLENNSDVEDSADLAVHVFKEPTESAKIVEDDDYDVLSEDEFQESQPSRSNTPLTDEHEVQIQKEQESIESMRNGFEEDGEKEEEEAVHIRKRKVIFDEDEDDD